MIRFCKKLRIFSYKLHYKLKERVNFLQFDRLMNPEDAESELRASLKRLQLDYLDLYLVHYPYNVVSVITTFLLYLICNSLKKMMLKVLFICDESDEMR